MAAAHLKAVEDVTTRYQETLAAGN
jgi:hypothetical protein